MPSFVVWVQNFYCYVNMTLTLKINDSSPNLNSLIESRDQCCFVFYKHQCSEFRQIIFKLKFSSLNLIIA